MVVTACHDSPCDPVTASSAVTITVTRRLLPRGARQYSWVVDVVDAAFVPVADCDSELESAVVCAFQTSPVFFPLALSSVPRSSLIARTTATTTTLTLFPKYAPCSTHRDPSKPMAALRNLARASSQRTRSLAPSTTTDWTLGVPHLARHHPHYLHFRPPVRVSAL